MPRRGARDAMRTAWVVDSNCFIHLGQKADDRFVADLRAALEGGKLLITPGVEQEVATVGFRRHKGRPRVLASLASLLHSIPVDDASIRALATRIGNPRPHRMWTSRSWCWLTIWVLRVPRSRWSLMISR